MNDTTKTTEATTLSEATSLITKQTGVTVGLAVVVLGASVSAAWWFGQWTGQDRAWKDATDKRLQSIESELKKGINDRWTGTDMVRWARRLAEQNPDLKVPEPYN